YSDRDRQASPCARHVAPALSASRRISDLVLASLSRAEPGLLDPFVQAEPTYPSFRETSRDDQERCPRRDRHQLDPAPKFRRTTRASDDVGARPRGENAARRAGADTRACDGPV